MSKVQGIQFSATPDRYLSEIRPRYQVPRKIPNRDSGQIYSSEPENGLPYNKGPLIIGAYHSECTISTKDFLHYETNKNSANTQAIRNYTDAS